ncbi:MAG TPA: choice-of-anchor D domain-containing protein, partial [Prosthecobacter sp.]|nr:choice-of-anchor D domain-containing protein [Prosthecobacter sp.]
QVSANDGLSWEDVYVQVGEVNEGGGNARSASLAAYEGKEIRLRFVYSFSSGGYFPASNGVGWFIDNIAFTNVTEISNAVTTSVPAGTTFDFTPPAVGDYVLAVRPVVTGGRALPYGPLLEVTGFSGPPPQAEVSLQQPAGTQLADAVSTVNYGPVNVGTPVVRTFTVANVGAEPLTGLAVSVDGANAGEFVAGALGAVSLSGGQSTTFTVTFTPAEVGARGAVLHLASNDGDENPFDVTLSGTGFAEPNITLQQPGGTNLTDGVSTVSYGTATLGVQTTRTFTIVNDGLLTLSGLAAVVEGTHAGDFAVGTPGMASLAPGQTTTFDVVFTPSAAGARVAVLRVASNDPDESPFDVTLSGTGSAQPVVLAPAPAAVMREAGGAAVIFAVTAIPDPLTYQWRKNGANIAGATVNSLTLNKPKLTDAGAYTVLVKRGTLSTISAVAQLGVVENVPKVLVVAVGGTATLKVSAAGNGLTYLWKRQDAAALPEARLGGTAGKKTTTNTLVIQKLDAATDSGVYRCEVTGPGGMVAGGTTELRVIDEGPVITTFDPPDGIVGGPYFAPVVMNGDADKTPTLFTATGLPPGLKMDPKTGNISGRPTKAGTYVIKLTASNSKGKTLPTPATVVIATFPDNVAGNYVGRVARSGLNGSLGGRIDLTVTPTGTFTGSLTMGVTKHALKGVLDIDVDQTAAGNPPRVVLAIPRAGKPAPTPLDLELEIDNNAFTANSKISADGDEAAIVGWRQVWHTTLNAAGAYEGYYTMIFRLGAAVAGAPQGSGYGSFKVAKDGKLTLAGRTADGELVTCAGFIGPSGQVVVYQALYAVAVKGSLLGQLQVGLAGVPADNTLSGALDWIRPPNLAASARIYELGFGNPTPVPLDAIGGKYTGAAATMILGLTTAGTDNARLVFTEGGVADSRRDPDVVLDVGLSNKITLPPVGAENEAGVKLTVAAATGIFSGTFVLDDPDPRKPPPATPVILKRTVTFQGMLVRDGTEQYGGGFFLLPKLPVGVQTPTTTDILSGKVVLEKAP